MIRTLKSRAQAIFFGPALFRPVTMSARYNFFVIEAQEPGPVRPVTIEARRGPFGVW